MKDSKCPACGVDYFHHKGALRVCEELQAAKEHIKILTQQLEKLHHTPNQTPCQVNPN